MATTQEQLRTALAGRYDVGEQLAIGGMATIYAAHDRRHDRRVALKVLKDDLAATVGADRFLREVRLAARLTHPHILPLYDSGSFGPSLYYVMPFVEGESLRNCLTGEHQLAIPDAVRLASEVGAALDYAHRQSIVHRDIKPENILLLDGHAVVADFGIARALDSDDQHLTATGVFVGTPAYMSPEQAAGERVDARSDIYALGCVLYEMLAGQVPFTGASMQAVIARHLTDPVPPIRTVRPAVSTELASVVERALAKTPADRFPTAAAFVAALRSASVSSAERAAARVAAAPTARRFASAPALLAALVVSGIAIGIAYARRPAADGSPEGTATELQQRGTTALDRRRVALLPFSVSTSADDYLADGILAGISDALSSTPDLTIVSSGSVRRARGTGKTTNEIGRQLSAGSVLEGTMARRSDTLAARVRLVDVNGDSAIWTQDYVAAVSKVRELRDQIAGGVATALTARLAVSAAQSNAPSPNRDAAFDAYLRALYFDNNRVPGSRYRAQEDSAIHYYERAIALDSRLALAYVGLASVYDARFFNTDTSRRWEQAAFVNNEKALRIDPNLAEAYEQKANMVWSLPNGFPHDASSKLHRKALQLKPSYAGPHFTLGALYTHVGLLDQALAQFDTAQNLDPENAFARPRIARIHYFQGKLEQAAREFAPYEQWAGERAVALALLGRGAEALTLLDRPLADATDAARADVAAGRAVVLASLRRKPEAEAQITLAQRLGDGRSHFHHAAYAIAQAYALLGDRDRALHWLDRVANEGMPCYPLFRSDPALAGIRGDPRFTRWVEEQRRQWAEFKAKL